MKLIADAAIITISGICLACTHHGSATQRHLRIAGADRSALVLRSGNHRAPRAWPMSLVTAGPLYGWR
jgi:hypothetical protein